MSRTLSNEMLGVTTSNIVRPIFLVQMTFDATKLSLWSGIGDLDYSGDTYLGLGDLLSISEIPETADISAPGINLNLSGVKTSFIAIAKDYEYQGRPLTVSLGAFDNQGALIANPIRLFSGFMDTMTITEGAETSSISVNVENKLVALQRSKVRRYTAEDQKIDHPNDKGFDFVSSIAEKEIIWGRPTGGSQGGGSGSNDNGNTKRY